MPIKTKPSGPLRAKVMVVAEAPGPEEEVAGVPLVGASGKEFTRMLHEAGLIREECFLTNVCKYRPPMNDIEAFFLDSKCAQPNELIKEGLDELDREIAMVQPELIIAFGNTAHWALTDRRGSAKGRITKWRGSMLERNGALLMPSFHPANVLREWANRPIVVHDLRRAREGLRDGGWPKREWRFEVRPSYEKVMTTLSMLLERAEQGPLFLASDIETRSAHIACHGIAWSESDAISIPSMCVERPLGYWTLDQDVEIWDLQRKLLRHRNVSVVGQNYLYDAQYLARRWGFVPNCTDDTLFMQAVLWPGLPKGLDFLSSMYRQYHVYWKDEGKTWDRTLPEDQLWRYNCQDAVATWEIAGRLRQLLSASKLLEQYEFQMRLWKGLLRMNLRGTRIDQKVRSDFASDLIERIGATQGEVTQILGQELNVRSPKQMQALFYSELKMPVVLHKVTRKPTTNEDALVKFMDREPLLKPLIQRLIELRSMGMFLSHFITAPLDADGRIRCSYGLAETLRLTSSESAFGTGTNLQNIPKDEDLKADIARRDFKLPNVRLMFTPDPGYTIFEIDLTGADAQVVAWTSGDERLKSAFRSGLKIHRLNAKDVYGDLAGKDGDNEPYYTRVKKGVHLTNYVGNANTCAGAMNVSPHEAGRFQARWFALHPEIKLWHDRVLFHLQTTRAVYNRFGYRRFYFDRIEGILPEAVAWEPQSTVALVTNKALVAIDESAELRALDVQLLLQIHDSLVGQYPTHNEQRVLPLLRKLITIPVPFEDELVIPWGLKTSQYSQGAAKETKWASA